jgi:hypothetical protein
VNREEIIRMAREAGMERCDCEPNCHLHTGGMGSLTTFAALVAAAEREACAKVAENGLFLHDDSPEARFGKACAAAIRARGQE